MFELVRACDEETRLHVWQTSVGGETARRLAQHPTALFPLQHMIQAAKSLELVSLLYAYNECVSV